MSDAKDIQERVSASTRVHLISWPGTLQLLSHLICYVYINPLNAKLNPICHLLALLGAHHILHVSRIRVNYPHCLIRGVFLTLYLLVTPNRGVFSFHRSRRRRHHYHRHYHHYQHYYHGSNFPLNVSISFLVKLVSFCPLHSFEYIASLAPLDVGRD